MPRYFLHLHDDLDLPDPEGKDLPDLATAREYANMSALDLMCGVLKSERRITLHHRIDIEDEQRTVLGSVRFGELVDVVD
jgi:hypothetical protein